ncbi:hypothetical protein KQH51_03550 [bacterium]|nr:hypothetical protein [bacterium]MCB2201997.1 hypothetical protein [bacterium]
MTERLYYTDPTMVEFTAVVTASGADGDRSWVELDRTAFYPTSGGQLADRGMIDVRQVVDVVETEDGTIRHVLDTMAPAVGAKVTGRIDEERRWRHRQQHTAQHMISALFARNFGHPTVSVHLGEEYGAVELDAPSVDESQREKVEREVNRLIRADEDVEIMMVGRDEAVNLPLRKMPDREGTIRVIRVGDLDWSACGGTHCRTTAEVGLVKIVGVEKQRGHILVKFLAGSQALADYERRFGITEALSNALTCHTDDLPANLDKLVAENKEQKRALAALRKELLPIRAQQLALKAETHRNIKIVFEAVGGAEASEAAALASAVAVSIGGVAALIIEGRLALACAQASGVHAGNVARAICNATRLRGGGNAGAAQIGGVDASNVETVRSALMEAVAGG